jgi:hypothetical protein
VPSASSRSPTANCAPDAGATNAHRASVEQAREREIPEWRRADDNRRQACLSGQRLGLGRVEAVANGRGQPVDGIGGVPAEARSDGQRAAAARPGRRARLAMGEASRKDRPSRVLVCTR